MKGKTSLLAVVAATAALGLAACGDDDETTTAADTPATPAATSDASVSFAEPMDGETTGDAVTAEVELQGFEIDAEHVGKANDEGHGHLHFSLDGGKYDYPQYSGANGKLAKQLGVEGMYSPAVEPTITYKDLPAGEHTLEVDLVNNDHSETGVSATTTFTVD